MAFDLIWLNGADFRALPITERRRHLQNIPPKGSAILCEALSVTPRGHKLFELMCAHDLEGIVAKRLKDPYGPRARWLKIKNPAYSQNEGRRELFERSVRSARAYGNPDDHRRRPARHCATATPARWSGAKKPAATRQSGCTQIEPPMTSAERLARCVLLLHHREHWNDNDRDSEEVTQRVLDDLVGEVLADERVKSGHAAARRR